ncbi:hypothetical protein Tco_0327767 [Tanacetum coccineum]
MDDPNITMEEYIRLEEEKARKHGKLSVEIEFPATSFNDEVSSKTLSCEPTVSSLNDEIDFRVSFDDSDDEDYTVVFYKNPFSYKKNYANDLKTDSENDNEKVMPLLPSPEPAVSCLDDLDFFKDFENEFSAIVYNDAPTSKLDLLTESILNPKHIDEFDLNNETSLSKYDEEEQNVAGYTREIVHDFEQRLETIFSRQVNRVHILDFEGLTSDMRQDLAKRMRMVYTGDDGQEELILEFFSTCRIEDEMGLDVAGTLCFQMGGARRSMPWRQFNALHSSFFVEPKMISST